MSHLVIPIIVPIKVADIATALLAYDQVQVHRSTNGIGGVYAEITDADTRPRLASQQTDYEYTDELGSNSYWYKYRLYNSGTLATGAFGTAFPGPLDPALSVLSIKELLDFYLFGVDLSDDENTPYPNSLYLHYIKGALNWLEHKFDVVMRPTAFRERQDYFPEDHRRSNSIVLRTDYFPVISVERVSLVLPGQQPVVYSKDWLQLDRDSGQIDIIPTGAGTLAFVGAPYANGLNRFQRGAFEIRYTAGFGPPPPGSYDFAPGSEPASVSYPAPKIDKTPPLIKEIVGKLASFGPLNIAGDLVAGAGIQAESLSIDGLSQSLTTANSSTNAGYGARLIQYQKELRDQLTQLARYYRGYRVTVA